MNCYIKIISGLIFLQIAPGFSTLKATSRSVQAHRSSVESACRGKEIGKFVKDPYACDKFFYCGSNEMAIVVDCPHGMIFNDEKEICDFPTNYLCVPRIKEDEEGVSTTSTKPHTNAPTTKESPSTTTIPEFQITLSTVSTTITVLKTTTKTTTALEKGEQKCPLNDTKTLIFLSHPYDCHRYYICYHGVPVGQECISELHWNTQNNRCDFPEKSSCSVASFVPSVPSTEATWISQNIGCPFRGEQIYPHPENCNYFIFCINGYATVQQCPFYHHFDIRSRRCLWQTLATCMISKK